MTFINVCCTWHSACDNREAISRVFLESGLFKNSKPITTNKNPKLDKHLVSSMPSLGLHVSRLPILNRGKKFSLRLDSPCKKTGPLRKVRPPGNPSWETAKLLIKTQPDTGPCWSYTWVLLQISCAGWRQRLEADREEVLEKVVTTRGPLSIARACRGRVPDDRRSASGAGRRLPLRKTRSADHAHHATCLGTS